MRDFKLNEAFNRWAGVVPQRELADTNKEPGIEGLKGLGGKGFGGAGGKTFNE